MLLLVLSEGARARTLVGPIEPSGRVTVRVSKLVLEDRRFLQIGLNFTRIPIRCDGGEVARRSLEGGLHANEPDDRHFNGYELSEPVQWGYKGHLVGKTRAVGDVRIFDIDFSDRLRNCRTPALRWTARQR